ncbi:hypothetical protein [uncultured Dubosiella sp.]|uniref:hypothetical protein n=3 Tax=uncultured Dubosiella sp. TaxID=1937011 RepID=UPI00260D8342|nr:hypothetical protein [uncultured Dubosiella sp.]
MHSKKMEVFCLFFIKTELSTSSHLFRYAHYSQRTAKRQIHWLYRTNSIFTADFSSFLSTAKELDIIKVPKERQAKKVKAQQSSRKNEPQLPSTQKSLK